MRDQLVLVQSPREIMDIELTPAQLTGVFLISCHYRLTINVCICIIIHVCTAAAMATDQSLVLAEKEPTEETLPSTSVYSTGMYVYMYIERVYIQLMLVLSKQKLKWRARQWKVLQLWSSHQKRS